MLVRIDTDAGGRTVRAPTISKAVNRMKGIVSRQLEKRYGKKDFMTILYEMKRII